MENGQPLTKADLIAALGSLKKEFKQDLNAGLASLKLEFKQDLTEVEDRLTEGMRQIETNLLTEFHRYGKGQQIRLHGLETNDANLTARLAVIEDRLLALEARRPPSV